MFLLSIIIYRAGQKAVLITQPQQSGNSDSKDKHDLRFSPSMCGLSGEPPKASIDTDLVINAEVKNKRKYRRTKKTKIPRYWRTRKDPFVNVKDAIGKWLEKNPERTAKSLILELQERYPGQYKDNQIMPKQHVLSVKSG